MICILSPIWFVTADVLKALFCSYLATGTYFDSLSTYSPVCASSSSLVIPKTQTSLAKYLILRFTTLQPRSGERVNVYINICMSFFHEHIWWRRDPCIFCGIINKPCLIDWKMMNFFLHGRYFIDKAMDELIIIKRLFRWYPLPNVYKICWIRFFLQYTAKKKPLHSSCAITIKPALYYWWINYFCMEDDSMVKVIDEFNIIGKTYSDDIHLPGEGTPVNQT